MFKSLTITHFRVITHADIELTKLNWIVGEEEQGKSTIPLGLEFSLWRRNEYINDKGEGISGLIKNGERKAIVSSVMDTGEYFQNTIPSNSDKDHSAVDYDPDILKACLRCRYILQLKERDQKALFQKVFLPEITSDDIYKELTNTPELAAVIDSYRDPQNILPNPDFLLSSAGAIRTDISGKISKLSAQIDLVISEREKMPTQQPVTKERYNEILKQGIELENKIEAERKKILAHKEKAEKELKEWEAAKKRWDEINKEVQAAEEEVKASVADVGADKTSAITENEKQLKAIDKQIKDIQDTIKKLTKQEECPPGQCVKAELRKQNNEMIILQDKREGLLSTSRMLINENNLNIKAQARAKAAEERWNRAQAVSQSAKPLGDKPAVTEIDESSLVPLQEQFKQVQYQELEAHWGLQFKTSFDTEAQKREELARLNEQYKIQDALVKALGPHGVRLQILQKQLDPLLKKINQKGARFGISVKIETDPWSILVDSGKGFGYVPYQFISHTALTKTSIVFQTLFAQKTGLNCIVIDEHGFGPVLRGKLFAYLLKEDIQSIVISTLIEVDANRQLIIPKHPGTPGVNMFLVSKGEVSKILPEEVQ